MAGLNFAGIDAEEVQLLDRRPVSPFLVNKAKKATLQTLLTNNGRRVLPGVLKVRLVERVIVLLEERLPPRASCGLCGAHEDDGAGGVLCAACHRHQQHNGWSTVMSIGIGIMLFVVSLMTHIDPAVLRD